MALPLLPLHNMAERHNGLTVHVAGGYLEAARVCLDRHHVAPQEFTIQDDKSECRTLVDWETTDERSRGAWANKDDSVRDGAYACIIAATELSRGLYAVRRAETLTGADYYVGPDEDISEDLEGCFRLEVSGTDRGGTPEVARRLKVKIEQARNGNSNLPALAGVIGFKCKLIVLQTVE